MAHHRAAPLAFSLLLLAVSAPTRTASAITVDGQLDPAYGPALVTQTTQTGLSSGQITGDNNLGDIEYANGSELDVAHALIENGVLHLFLGGNLAQVLNQQGNQTNGHIFDMFFDTAPGGQNTLSGLGSGSALNGLTFDAGFEADYWFEISGQYDHGPVLWSYGRAELSGGGGTLVTLGFGYAGGTGTLSGGANPFGILATLDNRNTAGVTFGCGASSGAGVTTGIEWAIPLEAIGSPQGCITATVIVRSAGGGSPVSNQVLAPLPVGTCPPGSAAFVNFAAIPDDQFFTICPTSADVPRGDGARLDLRILGPNPSRGERLRFAFDLPDGRPATLRMIDCTGRLVRSRDLVPAAGGTGTVDLSAGRRLAPGVYWARLTQGDAHVVRRICVVN